VTGCLKTAMGEEDPNPKVEEHAKTFTVTNLRRRHLFFYVRDMKKKPIV
jgi:hypothetical protein